jgi:hypothetical protein
VEADHQCVFPSFTPTFALSLKDFLVAAVARHVADAQQALAGHPGRRADGSPLHRTTDATLIAANRAKACPRSLPRPSGHSCDEYPMASTREGASSGGPYSARMLNAAQNTMAGGNSYLNGTYTKNRVLGGDAFWVSVTP